MKTIGKLILAVVILIVPFGTVTVNACDEASSDSILRQFLFDGSNETVTESDRYKLLNDAVYLCCEQADQDGSTELKYVNDHILFDVSMDDISVSDEQLFEASHTPWTYQSETVGEVQKKRKDLLRKIVNKTFEFGFLSHFFNVTNEQSDSLAAVLYYFHILSDHLQYDPSENYAAVNGTAIPGYTGDKVFVISDRPDFTEEQLKDTDSFYDYAPLDELDRGGTATARIGYAEIAEHRERDKRQLSNIKPTAWSSTMYPDIITSEALYNRCHLIAHSLGGLADQRNIVTGTRYLNEAMDKYENDIADYLRIHTDNHVLYRVTPVYDGDNLMVSGIQMEGYSIEDNGKGICFNVFCYNVQPGVTLNYRNGGNYVSDEIYYNETIIPFVTYDENEPDLITELVHYLGILFKDQADSEEYRSLMSELDNIRFEARLLAGSDVKPARRYVKTQEYEHDLYVVLKTRLPGLFAKEKFFKPFLK